MLLIAGTLLAACSPLAKRVAEDPAAVQAYESRLALLEAIEAWEITGRLAITDGKEGGSGALIWEQHGDVTRMNFRGTLSQGNWQLDAGPGGAELRLGDGTRHEAPDVEALVRSHVGWNVPVGALSFWVRGLAAGESWDERRLDESGRLLRLRQAGWTVEIDRYRDDGVMALPSRLTARRGDYAVKLVVKEWRLGGAGHAP